MYVRDVRHHRVIECLSELKLLKRLRIDGESAS